MRKFLSIALILLPVSLLGACNSRPSTDAKPASTAFKVALLTPGPVSDAGWNAAAYHGLELIKAKLGADTALVQTNRRLTSRTPSAISPRVAST